MRIEIDGVTLNVEVHGEGEPVLFVHGFPLSGEMWRPTVERLAGVRAIVPDLRGHGASEAGGEPDMERYARDLADLLDRVGEPGPVTVVGLSMGGYVAFELYRRFPERVRALVLVDTRAGPDSAEAAQGRLESAERVLREGSGGLAAEMAGKLFAPGVSEALRERWRGIMAATPPAGVAAALRAMARRHDSTETLRTLRVPVLVVVGEDDAITPPEEARRMAEAAPGARLEVVPGAGHLTPAEQPERFAALLGEFLDGLRR